MDPKVRDQVVDFIGYWQKKSGFHAKSFLGWLGLSPSQYHRWKDRYGQSNRHNAPLPRRGWLLLWERQAIIEYAQQHPQEGYRRLSYMMLDADQVAVSPSSVYRVLKEARLLGTASTTSSKKGKGFTQPLAPHQHWHVDVSYINICGTFYYLCSVLDGYSRFIVHWEIREQMKEADVEIIIERARERFPGVTPRIISDNGPQFIALEFKSYIRFCGMTHVRTSPFYPQSNGKIERWHQSLKKECIRPKTPTSLEEARQVVARFVETYNHVRLHSAIGYMAPADKLAGRDLHIFQERKRKLAQARQVREQTAPRAEQKLVVNL
ncbi:MAG: IS3 family transposase [Gemmatimonadetes bacterium]|nr:IS3 family transposase [Gemmatimonadota bacterium]